MALQSTSILAGITGSIIGIRQSEQATIQALRTLAHARNDFALAKQYDPSTQRTVNVASTQRSDLGSILNTSGATRAQVDTGIAALQHSLTRLDDLETLAISSISANQTQREQFQRSARSTIGEIASNLGTAKLSDRGLVIPITPPTETLRGVTISRVNRPIESDGLQIDFEIDTAATFSQLNGLIDLSGTATPGVLDNALEFELRGDDGTLTFSFTAGQTTNDIVSAINTQVNGTGIEAELSGTSVDLTARDIGSNTISLLALNDPGGIVTDGTNTGDDTVLNIDIDGRLYTGITGEGLRVSFDLVGVTGVVDVRADAVDTDVAFATINDGGKAGLGADGRVVTRFGFSGLNVGLLGAQRGGLGSIDLVNDPSEAVRIIQAAREDLETGISSASQFREVYLSPQVESAASSVGKIDQALLGIGTAREAIQALNSVRTETQYANAFSLLAQYSGLYTASAVSLL